MNYIKLTLALLVMLSMAGCEMENIEPAITFGDDVAFMKQHTDVIVLSDSAGDAQVAVVGAYQGRVMTSTAQGAQGASFGWINREVIASGEIQPHINVYGGEDRFWMGPEGGQFAIFFAKGKKFEFADWQTPAVIDTEPFQLVSKTKMAAVFTQLARVTNYSGTKFDIKIDRSVKLLPPDAHSSALGLDVPDSVKAVAYQTDNHITNKGDKAWTKETGLLSIWILGMYNPSDETTVVVPFEAGPENQLGPVVNDEYFGKVPADRLIVKDGVMFFSCDGRHRSKIGLSPKRAKPILGSYDAAGQILTLVQYKKPQGTTDYVNSMWELQDEPYAGDVVNSYNDGPPEPGKKPMGPFYELETSSPAVALKPGETLTHMHRTFHLQGSQKDLDAIAIKTLGVSLNEIKAAMDKTK
jgi:hypothetical protein